MGGLDAEGDLVDYLMATSEGDRLEFVFLQEIPQPKQGEIPAAQTTASKKGPRPSGKHIPLLGEECCQAQTLQDHFLVQAWTHADWRSTGILLRRRNLQGSHTVLACGGTLGLTWAKVRTTSLGVVGLMSCHLPHWTTLQQAGELLRNWYDSTRPLHGLSRLVCGGDLNETLTLGDGGGAFGGATARGEVVAAFFQELGLVSAESSWATPTYHPYNDQMRPRRLDYIFAKGLCMLEAGVLEESRHEMSSDHDAVELQVVQLPQTRDPRPCKLRKGVPVMPDKAAAQLRATAPPSTGEGLLVESVANLSQRLIVPKESTRFRESAHLGRLRQAAKRAEGAASRALWKEVHSVRKSEKRKWLKSLTFWATRGSWGAWKKLFGSGPRKLWEPRLAQRYDNWTDNMTEYLEGIFFRDSLAENDAARDEARLTLAVIPSPFRCFTMEEVQRVMAKWKSGRAAGPDGITYEALRIIMKDEVWGGFVLEELNDFLKLGFTTDDLYSTTTFMMAKKAEPTWWGDLRPITLSSALLKLLSQLTLTRVTPLLGTTHDLQWASPSKQPLELAISLGRMLRVCEEWKQETFLVKIDIRKAFDSIRIPRLLAFIARKLATRPKEARLLIEMVCHLGVHVEFLDQQLLVRQSNGVKQGAPESPVLFAALIAELANEVAEEFNMAKPQEEPGWEMPFNLATFADDMYLWHFCLSRLQALLVAVERKAADNGLDFQGDKTQVLTSVEGDKRTLVIGGKTVSLLKPGTLIRVLGTQQGFRRGPSDIAAEVNAKMRQVFWAHKTVFAGKMPLTCKWESFNAVVRGAALWQAAALPPGRNLLAALNTQQLRLVRVMAGLRRKQGEPFVEYEMRSLRVSRARLHLHQQERFSTFVLRQVWRLYGHVARQNSRAKQLLRWRGPCWWKAEQQKRGGRRHPGRFNAGREVQNDINAFLEVDDWMEAAQDRKAWKLRERAWVKSQDLPWASNAQAALEAELGERADEQLSQKLARQLQLQNLAPNKKKRKKAKPRTGGSRKCKKRRTAKPTALMLQPGGAP